jgi:hypothetical protein
MLLGAPPEILPALQTEMVLGAPPEMLPASVAEEIDRVKSDAQKSDLKLFIFNFSW